MADAKNLKLHVVGAVYGAKLARAQAHNGREPPLEVVRSHNARPHMLDRPDLARKATCVLEPSPA